MDANWGVDPTAPPPAAGDWRAQLQPEARSRIVNKIMECLKKHLPVSMPEGLHEIQTIAVRFEDKVYTAATSQSDYLRKISLKMLSMENTQQAPGNAQVIPNQNNPSQASCLRMTDGSPWRPTQGSDPASVATAAAAAATDAAGVNPNGPPPTGGDWRDQLQPEARSRIVNKIMECLKKHLPASVPEGLNEIQKIAVRFEEKIYSAATSQSDYLRKISLKMLSMEMKT